MPMSNPSSANKLQKKILQEKMDRELFPFETLKYNHNDIKGKIRDMNENLSLFAPTSQEEAPARDIDLDRPVTPINDEVKKAPEHYDQLAKYVHRRTEVRKNFPHLPDEDQRSLAAVLMGELVNIWPDIKHQVDDPFFTKEENSELHRRITVRLIIICEKLFDKYIAKAELLNKRGVFSGPANTSRLKAQLSNDASKLLNVSTIKRYIVSDMKNLSDRMGEALDGNADLRPITRKTTKSPVPSIRSDSRKSSRRSLPSSPDPKPPILEPPVLEPPEADLSELVAQTKVARGSRTTTRQTSRKTAQTNQRGQILNKLQSQDTNQITSQMAGGKLSIESIVAASRLAKNARIRNKINTFEENMKRLSKQMPTLDMSRIQGIVSNIPEFRPESIGLRSNAESVGSLVEDEALDKPRKRKTSADMTRDKLTKRHNTSTEDLYHHETLLEELEEGREQGTRSANSLDVDILVRENTRRENDQHVETPKPFKSQAMMDLEKLMSPSTVNDHMFSFIKKDDDEDDELPALLQALPRSEKHDGKKEELEKQLVELEQKEEERKKQETILVQEGIHAQPATVQAKLPNHMTAKASDIRVSERVCLSSMTLNSYQTVFNDLIEEVDAETVKQLDSNLFLGDEIREVYKEIMKTVPANHLNLEEDDLIEEAADTIDMSAVQASSTLNLKPSKRIINPNLHRKIPAPWGELSESEWAKTPQEPPTDFKGKELINPMVPRSNIDPLAMVVERNEEKKQQKEDTTPAHLQDYMARSYASWLQWWKSTLNSDDFIKYLSTQETDYLGVVFHFYNSDDEDPDEEDEATRTKRKQMEQVKRDKEEILKDLRVQKQEYKEGFWNAGSVLLGGLGKDPTEEDTLLEVAKQETPRDEESKDNKKQANKTKVVSKRIKQAEEKVLSKELQEKQQLLFQNLIHRGSGVPSTDRISVLKSNPSQITTSSKNTESGNKSKVKSPQDRLEQVWTLLHVPDDDRLDMAVKYSSDAYFNKMNNAITAWEEATNLILKRETLIMQLEQFERTASDPSRFFEKGSSSVARLEEAKDRSVFYRKILEYDEQISDVLNEIERKFNDKISFKGRPYLDKMKWDRVEMLYWLQEERKQQALEIAAHAKNIPLKNLDINSLQLGQY